MTWFAVVVCVASLLAGLYLLRRSRRLRDDSGLPTGRITYADTGTWGRCEQPLLSHRYRLSGRPDYLVSQHSMTIPVEIKSSTGLTRPYPSHVAQLVAYCFLLEESGPRAPNHGFIHYPDATFRVPYSTGARRRLLRSLAQMRAELRAPEVNRSHSDPGRCRSCGYREHCSQSL